MDNNDILRRLRYIFDYNDTKMIRLFTLAKYQAKRSEVSNWLKKEDDPYFKELSDHQLAVFLNGLIVEKRGRKEGDQPIAEDKLNNNIILRKLKIAFNLKTEDIIDVFKLVEKKISAHELSAFLRNPNHPKYKACNDQYLRNFLNGMQAKYRQEEDGQERPKIGNALKNWKAE